MKKIIPLLFLVCLIAFSCKKDNSAPASLGKTSKVTFNIGFSQKIVNLNVKGTTAAKNNGTIRDAGTPTLQSQVDVIYYGVYDASGKGVHIITQYAQDANFGRYTDDLKPGSYTVVIAAGKSGVLLGPNIGSTASALATDVISCGLPSSISNSFNPFSSDAFFEKLPLTVGDTDTNLSFALNRITSKLVINVNDAIPQGVYSIDFSIINTSFCFNVGTGTPVPQAVGANLLSGSGGYQLIATDIGTKNLQIGIFFLYANAPFSIYLDAFRYNDNADPTIAHKTIPGITAQVNAETLLSGDLFGGNGLSPTGGFQAVIDSAWSGSTIVPFSVVRAQKVKR